VNRVIRPLKDFLHRESASGILILIAALAGLGIANSPLANLYFDTLAIKLDFFSANLALELTILTMF
jgi:NhaA family Na+:H+ antiporter